MDYSAYANILDDECFQKHQHQQQQDMVKLESLLSSHADKPKVAISLSGGVDSMVMLHILNRRAVLEICAVHINYNNRIESTEEADFLDEYCKCEGVKMIRHDITHIKRFQEGMNRTVYEQETKSIRYSLYERVIADECVDGINLAHHDGDIIENIFNNVMKNSHIDDLSVLKKEAVINGITIFRPFIGVKKDIIMEYAAKYEVPYFKDTTPDWSCRGMMRNDIFPKCIKCYGDGFEDNLMRFSAEVKEMHDTLSVLMKTYMGFTVLSKGDIMMLNLTVLSEGEIVMLDLSLCPQVMTFPATFWKMIFENMCDKLHMRRFSKKSIDNFYMNRFNDNKTRMNMNAIIHKTGQKVLVFTGPCPAQP